MYTLYLRSILTHNNTYSSSWCSEEKVYNNVGKTEGTLHEREDSNESFDDCASLYYLNEPSILQNIRMRYAEDNMFLLR